MTMDEKQEEMFAKWLSGQEVKFENEEAEKSYKERITRLIDAIQLQKTPDRVPVCPGIGFFPIYYTGITMQEAMYEYEKAVAAWKKYVLDFEPDVSSSPGFVWPGKVLEILRYKLLKWPGYNLSADTPYQFVEGEYMKANEYDALIQDPTDFWFRVYFPRIFGALKPFQKLAPLTDPIAIPFLVPFGLPEVQAAMKNLLKAGEELLQWASVIGAAGQELQAKGYPSFFGGISLAPFDMIGDSLRGTIGIMVDMYRQPEKLLAALEVMTHLAIRMGIYSARVSGHPIVFIALHKGADGFLSDNQFRTFYWPTLRKVILGLVEEGLVPYLFAEGGYNSRLEVIRDIPKGKTIWLFDQTDMAKAKDILGDVACIAGNVPITLLTFGQPEEIKDYCRKLIKTAGKDGGFILSNGAAIDNIKPENLHALIESAKEFGSYH